MMNHFPKELIDAIRLYKSAGIKITKEPICEVESLDYKACRLGLNGYDIVFRVAKTTPTKIGQFVTVWKRLQMKTPIIPLDSQDEIDFLVIHVSDLTHQGQFIFDRQILLDKNILSHHNRGGKLSFRIYPPWTHPLAPTAIKTQQWQTPYFVSLSHNNVNLSQMRNFFV